MAQDSLANLLKRYNTKHIPYITVQELAMPKTNYKILDAREPDEYLVSHLKNAVFVGYKDFKIETILNEIPNKNDTIVVYCSLGIRSETISKKIQDKGYTAVSLNGKITISQFIISRTKKQIASMPFQKCGENG